MRIAEDTFKMDEWYNDDGSRYSFDIDSLSGEELLTLDELLADILMWDNEDADKIYDEMESLFERCYKRYKESHPNEPKYTNSYDDDKAWMYAERILVNNHIDKLSEVDDWTIREYINSGRLNDKQQAVWDKCVSENKPRQKQEYRVTDIYDFGPWTKNESVKSDNLIDIDYSYAHGSGCYKHEVLKKDKEYFKNKYEKKGYKNVWVKKVRTDTKGLPMYEIYGDKEVNESMRMNESEEYYSPEFVVVAEYYKDTSDGEMENDKVINIVEYPVRLSDLPKNFGKSIEDGRITDDISPYLAKVGRDEDISSWEIGHCISSVVYDEMLNDYRRYERETRGKDIHPDYWHTYVYVLRPDAFDSGIKVLQRKLGKMLLPPVGYSRRNESLYESINENCNSYSYKGKTIIDAGDYWFVKGYEEKFPTSDEAEEFVDDNRKDEGLEDKFRGPKPLRSFDDVLKAKENNEKLYYYEDGVGNDDNPVPVVVAGRPNKFQIPLARLGVDEPYTFTIMDFRNLSRDKAGNLDKLANESMKINIRESLNKMDAESDNTYDLLNLYESKNLSKSQKKDIARMIYENYGLEKIYKYLYEATEEEDELPVEDRVKELTNNFKNTNGSYVFEEVQDANKAVTILKSRGYEASQKRTQDNKYRVTAQKK